MMRRMLFLPLAMLLLSACLPTPRPAPYVPTAVPSEPPSAVPLPTVTATVHPTVPIPTLDAGAVAATVAAGETQIAAAGIEPLCLRREDSDNDGALEWIGLYQVPSDPPELVGFVLDGTARYDLRPPESDEARGLGEYATCELEIRDLTANGLTEIVVRGHTGASTDYLHVFAWDGTRYALLGAFEGRGGIRLADADGDLTEEIVVRLRPEGALVWEIVYTWDGTHYAWTWDRYAWFYLDRPHASMDDSPTHALASFYLALNDRDLPGAYGLISPAAQAYRPYDEWALAFATTMGVEVGAMNLVSEAGGRATVAAQVRALDNVDGRAVVTLYGVEWQMVQTDAGWRLEGATSDELGRWELPYYR